MLFLSLDDLTEPVDGHLGFDPVLQPYSSSISRLQLEAFPLRLPLVLSALLWEWLKTQGEEGEPRGKKGLKVGGIIK